MKNEIIKRNITQDKEFYWTECSGSIERLYEKHNGIKFQMNMLSTFFKPL